MYADNMTQSMQNAINITNQRRELQQKYNKEHNITPKTIIKDISSKFEISSKIKNFEDKKQNENGIF